MAHIVYSSHAVNMLLITQWGKIPYACLAKRFAITAECSVYSFETQFDVFIVDAVLYEIGFAGLEIYIQKYSFIPDSVMIMNCNHRF